VGLLPLPVLMPLIAPVMASAFWSFFDAETRATKEPENILLYYDYKSSY